MRYRNLTPSVCVRNVGLLALVALISGACSDDDKPGPDAAPRDVIAEVAMVDAKVLLEGSAVDLHLKDWGRDQVARDANGREQGAKDGSAVDHLVADLRPDILLPGDAATTPQCASLGGFCTPQRWVICPAGTEPVTSRPHQDCGTGWCCVKAPPSTCSQSGIANCVEGTTCKGCWGAASDTSLTCPAGRVCCMDICD